MEFYEEGQYSVRYDGWYVWNPWNGYYIIMQERDFIKEAEMISKARRIGFNRTLLNEVAGGSL